MSFSFSRPTPLASARWLVAVIMVGLLFSPPVVNLAELALFACLASSGELRRRLAHCARQPMVIATLALLAVILIGTLYSVGSRGEAWSMLTGWRKLLLLPIAVALFDDRPWKDRLGIILVAVASLCALASYAGLFFNQGIYLYPPAIIVRNHATQGMMFSVAAFVAVTFMSAGAHRGRYRRFWLGSASALLVSNVILVTPGRSGYVVLLVCAAALLLDMLHRQPRRNAAVYGLGALMLAAVIGSLALSPVVRERIELGIKEIDSYQESQEMTSMGMRMVLWRNTLEIIERRPIIGYGTGSFGEVYRQKVAGQSGWRAINLSSDPHNQYLKIAAEHGAVGLVTFLAFILAGFRQRPRRPYRVLGLGVLLSWCATSIFSSHFSTFSEGNFIALWCGAMLAGETTDDPEGAPNPGPKSILLVATRQMGDVLLATPLLRSLRRAYPHATIDVLVYTDKGGMLDGNSDCNEVIETDEHPDWRSLAGIIRRLWRRYDIAVTVQSNDRGHLFALLAGRQRFGLIPEIAATSAWKRASCRGWVLLDGINTPTVVQNLRLADLLGVPRDYTVVPPHGDDAAEILRRFIAWPPDTAIAVVHPLPMWEYKRWTDQGWRDLIAGLSDRGMMIAITGGPTHDEMAYCDSLANGRDVVSLAGRLPISALPTLFGKARCYIGPDTSVTHLAAACGTPTLAIYGPSNPVKWGPWPANWDRDSAPYSMLARPWQRRGNVLLLQGVQPPDLGRCLPCREEGCERHKGSSSRCLIEMPADNVLAAVDELLASPGT